MEDFFFERYLKDNEKKKINEKKLNYKSCILDNDRFDYKKYYERVGPFLLHLRSKSIDDFRQHDKTDFSQLCISNKILEAWKTKYNDDKYFKNDFHKLIFPIINQYKDMYIPFANYQNIHIVNDAILLHCINHTFKSNKIVVSNNKRLKEDYNLLHNNTIDKFSKDQGFVRPKVLILAPFQNDAYELIESIIKLVPASQKKAIDNEKRFKQEFYEPTSNKKYFREKPSDYQLQFKGNTNDDFKIGISFLHKTIKLYADFFKSDIIIASPVAVKMFIDSYTEKETETNNENKKFKFDSEQDDEESENIRKSTKKHKNKNCDIFSSIEILYIYKAETFLFQNWEHILSAISSLNKMPVALNNTNFFRVRNYAIDGLSEYFRQNIILSSFGDPQISSLFSSFKNLDGQIRISPIYSKSLLDNVLIQPINEDNNKNNNKNNNDKHKISSGLKISFRRLDVDTFKKANRVKHEIFQSEILKKMLEQDYSHTVIFVSHYFDFVILRNYFSKNKISFDYCSEHSSVADNTRSKSNFLTGNIKYLIITERFYFFRRIKIKGIKNLIFFDLPLFSHFFTELIGSIDKQNENCCVAIFSKFDFSRLERITGSKRAKELIESKESIISIK